MLDPMGVRAYTSDMRFPETASAGTVTDSVQVVLGRTQPFALHSSAETHTNIDLLLTWVRACPERSSLHFYVRSSIVDRANRKLQQSLQSLGCRVTATCRFSSPLHEHSARGHVHSGNAQDDDDPDFRSA